MEQGEGAIATLDRELTRLRALVEMAPVGMFETDVAGRCVFVNARWSEIAGMTQEEPLGDGWAEAIHPDDRASVFNEWSRCAEHQTLFKMKYRFRRPDGVVTWVLGQASGLQDAAGRLTGYIGTLTDITDRQAAEDIARAQVHLREQVEESAARLAEANQDLELFAALIENASDAIAITGTDEILRFANPSFRALLGFDEKAAPRSIFELLGLEGAAASSLRAALVSGRRYHTATSLRSQQGDTFPADIGCFGVRDPRTGQLRIAIVVRDLTDLRRAEEQRSELQAQVIRAQEEAIRELSTPLLPLADQVIAMPLVGAIDARRAQQILETLLEGVGEHRAEVAILDVTGVRTMDTQVADLLMRAARAARLLGADVVLTGISPVVAQTLIELGVEMGTLKTLSTLERGIAHALRRRSSAKARARIT